MSEPRSAKWLSEQFDALKRTMSCECDNCEGRRRAIVAVAESLAQTASVNQALGRLGTAEVLLAMEVSELWCLGTLDDKSQMPTLMRQLGELHLTFDAWLNLRRMEAQQAQAAKPDAPAPERPPGKPH